MKMHRVKWLVIPVLILGIYFLSTFLGSGKKDSGPLDKKSWAAPVETAAIERGPMALSRTFSGTLESNAEFLVAPKVSGRVEAFHLALLHLINPGGTGYLDHRVLPASDPAIDPDPVADIRDRTSLAMTLRPDLAENSLLHRRGVVLRHQGQVMNK